MICANALDEKPDSAPPDQTAVKTPHQAGCIESIAARQLETHRGITRGPPFTDHKPQYIDLLRSCSAAQLGVPIEQPLMITGINGRHRAETWRLFKLPFLEEHFISSEVVFLAAVTYRLDPGGRLSNNITVLVDGRGVQHWLGQRARRQDQGRSAYKQFKTIFHSHPFTH